MKKQLIKEYQDIIRKSIWQGWLSSEDEKRKIELKELFQHLEIDITNISIHL